MIRKEPVETIVFDVFKVAKEWWSNDQGPPIFMTSAYSLVDGSYIGDVKRAIYLRKKGIMPQLANPEHNTASIGFSPREQKWFGWSHRAIYGFGIGSEIKKGDCGYKPIDPKDMLDDMIRFWVDEENENVTKTIIKHQQLNVQDPYNERPGLGVLIETERVRKIDGEILTSTHWEPYPVKWGRGEWKAKTLEDAKQMAIDFADDVS